MKQWRLYFPVMTISRLLGVSRSGFHAQLTREPSRLAKEDECLKVLIKVASMRRNRLSPRCGAHGGGVYHTGDVSSDATKTAGGRTVPSLGSWQSVLRSQRDYRELLTV